jgi:hypothetical protein
MNVPLAQTRKCVESVQPLGPSGAQMQVPPEQSGLSPAHAACGIHVPAAVHMFGTPLTH